MGYNVKRLERLAKVQEQIQNKDTEKLPQLQHRIKLLEIEIVRLEESNKLLTTMAEAASKENESLRTKLASLITPSQSVSEIMATPLSKPGCGCNGYRLVAFPKSGIQWVNALMEEYFGGYSKLSNEEPRPKIISYEPIVVKWIDVEPSEKKNLITWETTHDLECKLPFVPEKTIYLLRNPVDVICSHMSPMTGQTNQTVHKLSKLYKQHFNHWVVQGAAKTIITYEEVLTDPVAALKRISKHFDVPFNKERAVLVSTALSKENMNKENILGPVLLSEEYNKQRTEFYSKNVSNIRKKIVDKNNEAFLKRYIPKLFEDEI